MVNRPYCAGTYFCNHHLVLYHTINQWSIGQLYTIFDWYGHKILVDYDDLLWYTVFEHSADSAGLTRFLI